MARDELLYTGQTSASYNKARRKAENEDKLQKQAIILPAAEFIQTEIANHRKNIANELSNLIHMEMKPEDVKATVMGLRLADSRMVLLENKIKSILKAKPLKTKNTEDDDGL